MEEYFKYEFGYVNIDDENFYLTNSGNWSDTENLEEKSKKGRIKQNARKIRAIIFLSVVFVVFLALFIQQMAMAKIAILLPVMAFFAYSYFKKDLSTAFKVPIGKINSIEKIEDGYRVNFRNAENEEDTVYLPQAEKKGEAILKMIELRLHS